MNRLPDWLKNKYVVTTLLFIVWLLFFDQNNMMMQITFKSDLKKLEKDKDFYTKEIEQTKKELEELTTNPKTLEKFAREKYYMKKEDEEIFLFVVK